VDSLVDLALVYPFLVDQLLSYATEPELVGVVVTGQVVRLWRGLSAVAVRVQMFASLGKC